MLTLNNIVIGMAWGTKKAVQVSPLIRSISLKLFILTKCKLFKVVPEFGLSKKVVP